MASDLRPKGTNLQTDLPGTCGATTAMVNCIHEPRSSLKGLHRELAIGPRYLGVLIRPEPLVFYTFTLPRPSIFGLFWTIGTETLCEMTSSEQVAAINDTRGLRHLLHPHQKKRIASNFREQEPQVLEQRFDPNAEPRRCEDEFSIQLIP